MFLFVLMFATFSAIFSAIVTWLKTNFKAAASIIGFFWKNCKITLVVLTLSLVYYIAMRSTGHITSIYGAAQAFSPVQASNDLLVNESVNYDKTLWIYRKGMDILSLISPCPTLEEMLSELVNVRLSNAIEAGPTYLSIVILLCMTAALIFFAVTLLVYVIIWLIIYSFILAVPAMIADTVLFMKKRAGGGSIISFARAIL